MKFYLIDDDRNILNILKLIITNRKLGTVCGTSLSGYDALEDVRLLAPDIIIVDLLMADMDGITFVRKANEFLSETAFIMLSQVSSKDMIGSAYEAGIEYFIQKPVNSVEVENVIAKVSRQLSMQRTIQKMQHIFMDEMPSNSPEPERTASSAAASRTVLTNILQRLGISGDIGSRDIVMAVEYLLEHDGLINDMTLGELCKRFSDSPKSMEQRIRRAANTGMVNLAHLGIEDYGNDIFTEYSNTLYNFEQVRREMDYIRGKSDRHGNVKIKNFLNALVVYSQNQ
ncbi:DNA-binding domain-containing protein [Extibacter muris]|uniref:DNA-binding domain-containing protein n=1 Tax=Extibacter muris TaxID=1796622 RepID=UPI001D06C9BD|nr:DNA-binding domain-containing protein [Extibacter muris]MCB6201063.1 response regulator [Extibacter muris]MCQ4662393.1 response regulator [Extibacter muris]MCQ4691680.1 response regulator [Extibacter muris]